MTDEKLSPKEYLREHDADGNATVRHTHDPASGMDAEEPKPVTLLNDFWKATAIHRQKQVDGLRELVGQLNAKLDNLLSQRCAKCGTTIPGDEALRQRIQDLEWAEVRVKKQEAELAVLRGFARETAKTVTDEEGTQWAVIPGVKFEDVKRWLGSRPHHPRCASLGGSACNCVDVADL